MRVGRCTGSALLVLLSACLVAARAHADAHTDAEGRISLDFEDAELATVVETVARAAGRRTVFDAELRGRITITAEDTVTPHEALEILHSALLMRGYGALVGPDGSLRVLPLKTAQAAAPWIDARDAGDSERLVATLVRLDAASAAELAQALEPLVSGIVTPYPGTNSLILATTELQLQRMLEIVRSLDHGSATRLAVVPLRWAEAEATARQLDELMGREGAGAGARILADARTNSLILSAPRARVAELEAFARSLDVPARRNGRLHVVRIRNADAEELAAHLDALTGADSGPLSGQPVRVIADPATNSLIVSATPSAFGELAVVIAELDVLPLLVSVDVHVFELVTDTRRAIGLSWILPLASEGVPPENTVALAAAGRASTSGLLPPEGDFSLTVARSPLVVPIVDADGNPSALLVPSHSAQLEAQGSRVSARTIARPRVLGASGEEQRLFGGENIPVPVSTDAQTANPFVAGADIRREDVGIELRVTPRARSRDEVDLELFFERRSVVEGAAVGVSDDPGLAALAGPVLRNATLETEVRLSNGEVLLTVAAPQETRSHTELRVPFLGSLPVLGALFRSEQTTRRFSHLIVAVQANVIDSPERLRAESISWRLAFERQVARVRRLHNPTRAPYALLTATRVERVEAERLAHELAERGPVEVVSWSFGGEARFDVYRTGFFRIAHAGREAVDLRARGLQPKLVHTARP